MKSFVGNQILRKIFSYMILMLSVSFQFIDLTKQLNHKSKTTTKMEHCGHDLTKIHL